jgi:rhodanese-related sulfurtransferase
MELLKMAIILIIVVLIIMYIVSINSNGANNKNTEEDGMNKVKYVNLTASEMTQQIKDMNKDEYVILDVRTKEEYDEERIPNSVLLTLSEIENKAAEVLPNKDIKIYVYCRSGRRSLEAAYKLIDLGYKNVYDFGGIIDYPYEKIKGTE